MLLVPGHPWMLTPATPSGHTLTWVVHYSPGCTLTALDFHREASSLDFTHPNLCPTNVLLCQLLLPLIFPAWPTSQPSQYCVSAGLEGQVACPRQVTGPLHLQIQLCSLSPPTSQAGRRHPHPARGLREQDWPPSCVFQVCSCLAAHTTLLPLSSRSVPTPTSAWAYSPDPALPVGVSSAHRLHLG